jgi:hypothetical protein
VGGGAVEHDLPLAALAAAPSPIPELDFPREIAETRSSEMSTQEIIAELPKLSRADLAAVDAKLRELLQAAQPKSVWDSLLEIAGTVEGLPPDYAENHDHYIHGLPKR